MIFTSYFANLKNCPKNYRKVAICQYPPKGWSSEIEQALTPTKTLFSAIKYGKITMEEFDEQFNEQLSKLDPLEVGFKYQDSILLCYEKDPNECHRKQVAEWLESNGVGCEEYSIGKEVAYKNVKRAPIHTNEENAISNV